LSLGGIKPLKADEGIFFFLYTKESCLLLVTGVPNSAKEVWFVLMKIWSFIKIQYTFKGIL
jgi:hypothetical protein